MPTENLENNIELTAETDNHKAWIKVDDTTWRPIESIYVKISDTEWKGGEF
jgi:hypothetical protein